MPKTSRKKASPPARLEGRVADYLTAAWMLAVFTALACELGSAAAVALRRVSDGLALLGAYLLFAALVIGLISLLLAVAVWRTRRQAPPRGITVFAVVVGVTPLLVVLLQWLF